MAVNIALLALVTNVLSVKKIGIYLIKFVYKIVLMDFIMIMKLGHVKPAWKTV